MAEQEQPCGAWARFKTGGSGIKTGGSGVLVGGRLFTLPTAAKSTAPDETVTSDCEAVIASMGAFPVVLAKAAAMIHQAEHGNADGVRRSTARLATLRNAMVHGCPADDESLTLVVGLLDQPSPASRAEQRKEWCTRLLRLCATTPCELASAALTLPCPLSATGSALSPCPAAEQVVTIPADPVSAAAPATPWRSLPAYCNQPFAVRTCCRPAVAVRPRDVFDALATGVVSGTYNERGWDSFLRTAMTAQFTITIAIRSAQLAEEYRTGFVRLLDSALRSLRLMLVVLLTALAHQPQTPAFLLVILATARHYGHRGEPDGRLLPAAGSAFSRQQGVGYAVVT
jgi:hypothetical protein